MASTASTVLRLELMATGENDTTWGNKANTTFQMIEAAIAGTTAISTTGGDTTLTNVDYTNDQAKKAILDVTGTLASNATIIIPNASKTYKVFNRTSGAYTLTIKTSSGTGIVITQSTVCEVYCDGSNVMRFATPMSDFGTGAPATASGAAASAISVSATGNLASTNAQAALVELQTDIDTINTTLTSSYQPLDSDLTTIAGLSSAKGSMIVGTGAGWAAQSAGTDGYAWIAKSGATNGATWAALMPAGESILFYKNTAPTGWTLVTSLDNGAIRIVSGSGAGGGTGGDTGGTADFTTVFAARTLERANLPNTSISCDVTDPGHQHFYTSNTTQTNRGDSTVNVMANPSSALLTQSAVTGISVAFNLNGNVTQTAVDFAVKYASFVRCTKDAY